LEWKPIEAQVIPAKAGIHSVVRGGLLGQSCRRVNPRTVVRQSARPSSEEDMEMAPTIEQRGPRLGLGEQQEPSLAPDPLTVIGRVRERREP